MNLKDWMSTFKDNVVSLYIIETWEANKQYYVSTKSGPLLILSQTSLQGNMFVLRLLLCYHKVVIKE